MHRVTDGAWLSWFCDSLLGNIITRRMSFLDIKLLFIFYRFTVAQHSWERENSKFHAMRMSIRWADRKPPKKTKLLTQISTFQSKRRGVKKQTTTDHPHKRTHNVATRITDGGMAQQHTIEAQKTGSEFASLLSRLTAAYFCFQWEEDDDERVETVQTIMTQFQLFLRIREAVAGQSSTVITNSSPSNKPRN